MTGVARRALEGLARHAGTLVYLVLASALFSWVAWDAFRTRIIAYHVGSDYWEHSATLHALIRDLVHPRNPHLDSPASSPRFVPFFVLAALLARVLSWDALDGMSIVAVLNTLLFLTGIYTFFRAYFRSRWAPVVGLVVLFGSWWDAWHFSNVYQLKVFFSVVGYPSTTALGASMVGFALTLQELRVPKPRPVALAALTLIWAFILITHPLTAMMGWSGAVLLFGTTPGVPLRRRVLLLATVAVAGLLVLFWPYFSPWQVIFGGTGTDANWVDKTIQTAAEGTGGDDGAHMFYRWWGIFNTLGLAVLGIPVALYLLIRREWFIPLGVLSMATPFIANIYVSIPLGHRFILLGVFYLQLAVVWFLMRCLPPSRRIPGGLGRAFLHFVPIVPVAGILIYFGWENVEQARGRFEYTARRHRGGGSPFVRFGRHVGELTGENAVVLADARTSWSLPTFGPKVVPLFHGNPFVADEELRTAHVRRFFHSGVRDRERDEILERYRVTHVIVQRSRERPFTRFLSARGERQLLPSGYVLYTLGKKL